MVMSTPRGLAPTLTVALRETIRDWFAARGKPMQESELILAALADLAAEQISENPTHTAQVRVMNHFANDIIRTCNAANRLRMSGIEVTTVTQ
jgi:hypothetical protein